MVWFKRVSVGLLLLPAVVALLLVWLIRTESGLKFALDRMAPTLQYKALSGSLSDFEVGSLIYKTSDMKVSVNSAKLKFRIWPLFRKSLFVDELSVASVRYSLKPQPDAQQPTEFSRWQGLDLPVDIRVKSLSLKSLIQQQWGATDETTLLKNVLLTGNLDNNTLHAKTLSFESQGVASQLSGSVDLAAVDSGKVVISNQIHVRANGADTQQKINVIGSISGTWKQLQVQQAVSGDLNLTFDGSVDNPLEQFIKWQGDIKLLSPYSVPANDEITLQSLSFNSYGTLDVTDFSNDSLLFGGLLNASATINGKPWNANGDVHLQDNVLNVESLKLNSSELLNNHSFFVNGTVGSFNQLLKLSDFRDFVGELNVRGRWEELNFQLPELSELVGVDGEFSVVGDAGAYTLTATSVGQIQQRQLDLSVLATLKGRQIKIQRSNLRAGDSNLKLNGLIGDTFDLKATVSSPDIGQFIDDARGSVVGDIDFKGSLNDPAIVIDVDAKKLAWQEITIDDLSIKANGDSIDPQEKFHFKVAIDNVASQSQLLVKTLKADIEGNIDRHFIALDAQLPEQTNVTLTANGEMLNNTGGADQGGWNAHVTSLLIQQEQLGEWALQETMHVATAAGAVSVSPSCLANNEQQLCYQFNSSADAMRAKLNAEKIDLDGFNPFLKSLAYEVGGIVNAKLDVDTDAQQQVNLEGEISSEKLSVTPLDADTVETVEPLSFSLATLTFSKQKDATANVQLVSEQGAKLNGELNLFKVDQFPQINEAPLSSRVKLSVPDMSALPEWLFPDVHVVGELDVDTVIEGSLATPLVNATAHLNQAEISIPSLGIELQDIKLDIQPSQDSVIDFNGTASSNNGVLDVVGKLDIRKIDKPKLKLDLKSSDFLFINSGDMRATGGVDLVLSLSNELVDLRGSVQIDEAALDLRLPPTVVTPSKDVVYVNQKAQAERMRQRIDLMIDFGDNTSFKSQGLDAKLKGKLRVFQEFGNVIRAEGQVDIIDGNFDVYSKNLAVESGALIFTGGSIDNPTLDIQIRKTVENVSAGVNISGTAKSPRLNLFSNPTMSDQDILATIVFDKKLAELGTTDAIRLVQLANSVRNNGEPGKFAQVVSGLQNSLGLSELDITGGQSPSIVAGKHLSDKFYVGYGYSLLDATQSLILKYQLSKTWSIRGNLGGDQGADLRYQIER